MAGVRSSLVETNRCAVSGTYDRCARALSDVHLPPRRNVGPHTRFRGHLLSPSTATAASDPHVPISTNPTISGDLDLPTSDAGPYAGYSIRDTSGGESPTLR
jgi:hypothetical protein